MILKNDFKNDFIHEDKYDPESLSLKVKFMF